MTNFEISIFHEIPAARPKNSAATRGTVIPHKNYFYFCTNNLSARNEFLPPPPPPRKDATGVFWIKKSGTPWGVTVGFAKSYNFLTDPDIYGDKIFFIKKKKTHFNKFAKNITKNKNLLINIIVWMTMFNKRRIGFFIELFMKILSQLRI